MMTSKKKLKRRNKKLQYKVGEQDADIMKLEAEIAKLKAPKMQYLTEANKQHLAEGKHLILSDYIEFDADGIVVLKIS